MTQPEPEDRGEQVARFDRVERAIHWTNAALFLFLIVTGFTLRGFPGTGWIGNRKSVRLMHLYVGLALPLPVVLGIVAPFGRQLRADLGRINRWTDDDRRWWSRRTRKANNPPIQLGKFNPGQKANAVFIGAALLVMPFTGIVMHYGQQFSLADSWRTGSTWLHTWWAFGILVAVVGHIALAFGDRDALRGMVRGHVPARWARHERPRWYAEMAPDSTATESVSDAPTPVP